MELAILRPLRLLSSLLDPPGDLLDPPGDVDFCLDLEDGDFDRPDLSPRLRTCEVSSSSPRYFPVLLLEAEALLEAETLLDGEEVRRGCGCVSLSPINGLGMAVV